jgi:hypothetical protein
MRHPAPSTPRSFPSWLGPRSLAAADGGRVTVLREGGRVIGLFPGGSQTNLLWTHPALASAAASRRLCRPGSWSNLGGDRTWLSPEVEFFYPQHPDTTVYLQPREFDPGAYRADDRDPDVIRLTNGAMVTAHRTGRRIPLRITKAVRLAANPLGGSCPRGVAYAGYSLEVTLEVSAKAVALPYLAIWNLLQLPHGGELVIPTYAPCRPTPFFGTIPAGDLRVTKRCISYRMAAAGEQKISVPAVATTGRMAYLHRAGRSATVVIRSFQPDPSGIYADSPVGRPAETGFAVQACNVDSHWGSFSEMEHHAPAIGGDTGLRQHRDVSQVWGFSGPRDAIDDIMESLCGARGRGERT